MAHIIASIESMISGLRSKREAVVGQMLADAFDEFETNNVRTRTLQFRGLLY
jgi:hypothetical protein